MPNPTIPAAATGLPNSRRAFLTSLGIGVAGTSLAAAAMPAASSVAPSPELLRLIDDHRAAAAVYVQAKDRHAEAKALVEAVMPEFVPFRDHYGKNFRENKNDTFAAWKDNLPGCIKQAQFEMRWHEGLISDWTIYLSPKRQKQMKAALRGAMKDAEKAVCEVFARIEEAKQISGFEDLERTLERTDADEVEALRKLCRYRCQSLLEIQLRADYLVSIDPDRMTADCIITLLPVSRKEATDGL